MRRYRWPFNGKRFIGNRSKKEVHDLDNEKTLCQVDEIKTEHVVTFSPDTKEEAKRQGYDYCAYCIGGSTH